MDLPPLRLRLHRQEATEELPHLLAPPGLFRTKEQRTVTQILQLIHRAYPLGGTPFFCPPTIGSQGYLGRSSLIAPLYPPYTLLIPTPKIIKVGI